MSEIKKVIDELNNIYKRTSVRLDIFWDMTYAPRLVDEKTGSEVYIYFDTERNEYVGRLNNPFDGDEL